MADQIISVILLIVGIFVMAYISNYFEEKERARIRNAIHKGNTPFPNR